MALTLAHYRFGVNELAESTHGWHAAEDTDPAPGVIALDTTFLLRFTVQANTTGLSNVDNEFQYRVNGGTWTNITTSSTFVRAVAVTPLTNGGNCTKRLSGTGTFESSGAGQTEDGTSGGTANDIVASGNSETECGLILRSADLTGGETIEFRLTRDGGQLLNTYAVVPTLTIPLADAEMTLNVTLGALTAAATATVDVAGALNATLGALTSSATAAVEVVGTLNATLGALTLVATMTASAPGSDFELDQTLGALTCSATAAVEVAAALSATLGAVTLNATAEAEISAAVEQTLGALTVAAAATAEVSCSVSAVLGALTLAATATAETPPVPHVYVCAQSNCAEVYAAAKALLSYPAAGQHVGGGIHVDLGGGPGAPGWTDRHSYAIHHTVSNDWAHPLDATIVSAMRGPAFDALTQAQKDALIQAESALEVGGPWIPGGNPDCAWEEP